MTVAPLLAGVLAQAAPAEAPGLDQSFTYLLLGSMAAVGFAMALGTIAALVRYHRTGAFPGNEPGQEVVTRRYVGLWIRVVVGTGLAIYGVAVVANAGIL